jgi:murein DD-endopeptidase MepM/ murein hydrolase activator NlpD
MKRRFPALTIFLAGILLGGVLPRHTAASEERKKSISIGEARKELAAVAVYQGFPDRYRLDRVGSLQVNGTFYHVFDSEIEDRGRWRTLVFSNSGDYLGYYETIDKVVELERDALIYPDDDYSAASGDHAEGEFDSGNAYYVRFAPTGPPDEVKFENRTYRFISSPKRVRPDDPTYPFIQSANRIANAMNNGRYKNIRDDFSPRALLRLDEQQTVEAFRNLRQNLGRIDRVDTPWIKTPGTAILPVTFEKDVAGMKLTLDSEGRVDGLTILPFKTAFPELGKNPSVMQLPVSGRWRLMWGGSTRSTSKYFGNRSCHHILEFVVSSRFGKTYRDEGRRNEDYMAYGQVVKAPAAGKVVAVIDGVQDNPPHAPNPFDRLGNAVMIRHTTNEYSVVAHLMPRTIAVKVGDEVAAGQPMARCGNSGDSSQPSVYFQLQDSPDILGGSGYQPVFSDIYVWNGRENTVHETYSPARGEYVQQRSVAVKAQTARQGGYPEMAGQ